MMKFIISVALIVALGVFGIYLYTQTDSATETPNTEQPQTTEEQQQVTEGSFAPDENTLVGTAPFSELAQSEQGVACTISFSDPTHGEITGQTYVNSGNLRGDFVYMIGSEQMRLGVLNDGISSHVWGDSPVGTFGIKYELADTDAVAQFDYSQEVTYSCAPWEPDSSFFTPPADFVFNDAQPSVDAATEVQLLQ